MKGFGWLTFAGIMLMIVGFFNVIGGLTAIDGTSSYLVNEVLFSNLETWGWFFLIWGIIQICASFAILTGRTWGAVVGIFTASLNAIAQLAWLNTNTNWALVAILVDILVIYGLAVYGGQRTNETV
jgi:hypothetical protein